MSGCSVFACDLHCRGLGARNGGLGGAVPRVALVPLHPVPRRLRRLRSRSQRLLLRSERGLSRSVLLTTTLLVLAAAAAAAAARGLPQRPRRPYGLQSSRTGGGDLTLARLCTPQRVRVAQQLLQDVGCWMLGVACTYMHMHMHMMCMCM